MKSTCKCTHIFIVGNFINRNQNFFIMKYRIVFYTFEYEGVNAALDKSMPMSRYACRKYLRENGWKYEKSRWRNGFGSFAAIVEYKTRSAA